MNRSAVVVAWRPDVQAVACMLLVMCAPLVLWLGGARPGWGFGAMSLVLAAFLGVVAHRRLKTLSIATDGSVLNVRLRDGSTFQVSLAEVASVRVTQERVLNVAWENLEIVFQAQPTGRRRPVREVCVRGAQQLADVLAQCGAYRTADRGDPPR